VRESVYGIQAGERIQQHLFGILRRVVTVMTQPEQHFHMGFLKLQVVAEFAARRCRRASDAERLEHGLVDPDIGAAVAAFEVRMRDAVLDVLLQQNRLAGACEKRVAANVHRERTAAGEDETRRLVGLRPPQSTRGRWQTWLITMKCDDCSTVCMIDICVAPERTHPPPIIRPRCCGAVRIGSAGARTILKATTAGLWQGWPYWRALVSAPTSGMRTFMKAPVRGMRTLNAHLPRKPAARRKRPRPQRPRFMHLTQHAWRVT
jgi:hypothetical protein